MNPIAKLLAPAKVIPVVTFNDPEHILPLAECLLEGGVKVIEVTLRSAHGLKAIEAIRHEHPALTVGAGTVRMPQEVSQALAAGAEFLVTPATPPDLLAELERWEIAVLPAAASPTEILTLRNAGYSHQKLFPAAPLGGIDYLKAMAGPFADVSFCPSGGISHSNQQDYLALDNVFCVSGSWLTPTDVIAQQDWQGLTDHVKHCLAAQ